MQRPDEAAPDLSVRAMDNLRFIRETMERAGAFTAVPGWGGVVMGTSALVTAVISGPPDDTARWVTVWLIDAVVAVIVALGATVWKARVSGVSLSGVPALRFALAFAPPLVAGIVLTPVFVMVGLMARLPGCWLLQYGTA